MMPESPNTNTEHGVSGQAPDHEMSVLIRYLDAQRDHVLGILDGLDDDALRRPVLPSGWSCLGLVRHLALDVERFWFGAVIAGDDAVIQSFTDITNAWQVDPDTPPEAVFDLYRQETERASKIASEVTPGSAPAWWPSDLFGDFRLNTVREIILHVMTETACHSGHLDAARELIDGRLWLVIND